jgi:uncharacterized membrane protein YphA (DoxX/SURF4 family)
LKHPLFGGTPDSCSHRPASHAVIAPIGSHAPKVLLYKDCAVTALIGLIFLGSCVLVGKPVVFGAALFLIQAAGTALIIHQTRYSTA